MQNNLNWKNQFEKVNKKVNHGLYQLKRLQSVLDKRSLKIVSDGLVMSNIRYCLSVYASGSIRISEEEPKSKLLSDLQVKQNNMLRIINKCKLSDQKSIKSMLENSDMLSVNQLACLTILLDMWKAIHLEITPLKEMFQPRNSIRFQNSFKTSEDPNSFITKGAKLWERSSKSFKETNLLTVAKKEAIKFVKTLPI